MDLVFKIVAIGIVTCISTIIIKPVRPDFAVILGIVGSIIVLFFIIDYLTNIFDVFKNILNLTGLNISLYSVLVKIIGIGYLIEFTASMCNDTGNSNLADKIILGGKVIILVMALPIITYLLDIITGLLPL